MATLLASRLGSPGWKKKISPEGKERKGPTPGAFSFTFSSPPGGELYWGDTRKKGGVEGAKRDESPNSPIFTLIHAKKRGSDIHPSPDQAWIPTGPKKAGLLEKKA